MYQIRFSGRYKIESLIKTSKSKRIYKGRNIQTGQLVAIKVQFFKPKAGVLLIQGKFHQMTQGCPGIPWMHWCGSETDNCNCLIIQYLGYSLKQLFQKCNNRFSLKSVVMLGLQMLQMIQVYHFRQLIHRNLTLSSFQMGKGKKNHKLYFNDLINSKKYIETKTGQHIPQKSASIPELVNIFNSVNVLKGIEYSRRDDLESLVLILIYVLRGQLPWQSYEMQTKQNYRPTAEQILKLRSNIKNQDLCAELPKQLLNMLNYVQSLKFTQKPDYQYLQTQLKKIQTKNRIVNDYVYDWISCNIYQNQKIDYPNFDQKPINCEIVAHEKYFLNLFYDPYQEDIRLDEIQVKFRQKKALEYQFLSQSVRVIEQHKENTAPPFANSTIIPRPGNQKPKIHEQKCILF